MAQADDFVPLTQVEESEPRPAAPRRKLIAMGAALLFPGGAHFYAQSLNRGFAIVAAYAVAITAAMMIAEGGLLFLLPVLLADIVGGVEAVDRHNRGAASQALGARASRAFAWTAWLWAVLPAAVSYGLQTHAPQLYIGESGRALCALDAACLEPSDEPCESLMVDVIGALGRGALDDCAVCVAEQSCESVWRFEVCDPEPMDGLGEISSLFGDDAPSCHPAVRLRGRCETTCAGILYDDASRWGARAY